jgi:hypothetical protein
MKAMVLAGILCVTAVAGCATPPDTGSREWAALQPTVRAEQAPGRATGEAEHERLDAQYRAMMSDEAWLAEYAAYALSIRQSVAAGDLTPTEGERLIARKRRNLEAERTSAVRYAVHYSYPDN